MVGMLRRFRVVTAPNLLTHPNQPPLPAHAPARTPASTVELAGRSVTRIGFGALHLAGPGGWGAPVDRAASVALVRAAVEAGLNYIDTADSLGPDVSEAVIAEALAPYGDDIVVATKAGMLRTGPSGWAPHGHPRYLKQQAHASRLRLCLDRIPLFYLHRIDPAFTLEDQLGALVELRNEGVIDGIGLSAVTAAQLTAAQQLTPIAAVQNHYNLVSRDSDDVLALAEAAGIPFVAFWTLGHGRDLLGNSELLALAASVGHSPAQLLIAWLLHRSDSLIALPGTSRIERLLSNADAAALRLDPETLVALETIAAATPATPAFATRD